MSRATTADAPQEEGDEVDAHVDPPKAAPVHNGCGSPARARPQAAPSRVMVARARVRWNSIVSGRKLLSLSDFRESTPNRDVHLFRRPKLSADRGQNFRRVRERCGVCNLPRVGIRTWWTGSYLNPARYECSVRVRSTLSKTETDNRRNDTLDRMHCPGMRVVVQAASRLRVP